MLYGVVQETLKKLDLPVGSLVSQLFDEVNAALLQLQGFGVLQRKVEEGAGDRGKLPVVTALDCLQRVFQGEVVGRKRFAGASVDVARELVEQKHERQATVGVFQPGMKTAFAGVFDQRAEPFLDL